MGGTSCSMAIGEKTVKLNPLTNKWETTDVKILKKYNVKT
jgi:hypothetical protein